MTLDILTTSETIVLEGKTFTLADEKEISEWPCVVSQRPQPTITLKDDDLFLVTDTMGNISDCYLYGSTPSMGMFCRDTRFLSRLELQI